MLNGTPPPPPPARALACPFTCQFTKSAVTHKATKRALTQLTESLAEELAQAGVTGIGVHNLSPGAAPQQGAGRTAAVLQSRQGA